MLSTRRNGFAHCSRFTLLFLRGNHCQVFWLQRRQPRSAPRSPFLPSMAKIVVLSVLIAMKAPRSARVKGETIIIVKSVSSAGSLKNYHVVD